MKDESDKTRTSPKTFYTFKRNGLDFLMIPNGLNWSVCDSEGNNYGGYMSQESFEHMAKAEGSFTKLRLGRCAVHFSIPR